MKTYIGIDPGEEGFLAAMGDSIRSYISIKDTHPLDIAKWLEELSHDDCFAAIEDVHALYGASAVSTFNFGYCKGWLVGLLTALQIPYTMVAPKDWQREIWERCDKVMDGNKVVTKATSINCAKRLFPYVDLRRTEKCKNPDHNKADSLLILEYARRKNL